MVLVLGRRGLVLGRRWPNGKWWSSSLRVNYSVASIPLHPQPSVYPGVAHQTSASMTSASYGASRSAEVLSISQKVEVAIRALQESINSLKESHKITTNSLVRIDTNIAESLTEISSLEKSLKAADDKYIFMEQLRDFISVMCDFLNDKAFLIEELEEQMQKLHEKRALAVVERRAADIADDDNEVESTVNAALAVLNSVLKIPPRPKR